jgi:hypothetical protein
LWVREPLLRKPQQDQGALADDRPPSPLNPRTKP